MSAPEKSLLRAWGLLMGLSVALAIAAESARPLRYVLVWTALVCIVAFWKARIVLSAYLGLRVAPSALGGFSFAIAAILAIVFGSFAVQILMAALV
ncbi:MAG TPA: hypothetical protein PKA55_15995 [Rhodoblastus sp.]|nr:hypothetical protein [Rhodoblastus sp.]